VPSDLKTYPIPSSSDTHAWPVLLTILPPPPSFLPLPSSHEAKENQIIAAKAIIPNNLIVFFIKTLLLVKNMQFLHIITAIHPPIQADRPKFNKIGLFA
jgi:hypothetical protein